MDNQGAVKHIYLALASVIFFTILYVFVLIYIGQDNEILKGLIFWE